MAGSSAKERQHGGLLELDLHCTASTTGLTELHDIHTKRTTVLHALPVYLREDVSGFLRTCTDESDEPELDDVAVALLSVEFTTSL